MFNKKNKPAKGAILLIAVCILGVCMFFAASMHFFVSSQRKNNNTFLEKQVAHYIANSGIDIATTSIESIIDEINKSPTSKIALKFKSLLNRNSAVSITSFFRSQINDLISLLKSELNKNINLKLKATIATSDIENNSKLWSDPNAKVLLLKIKSTGCFKDVEESVIVTKQIIYSSMLLPVVSKFTLHLQDASENNRSKYNIIKNKYDGSFPQIGVRPLTCFNNPPNEKQHDADVYTKRGWIFLGGGLSILQISSGTKKGGEVFHFYKVSKSGKCNTLKFSPRISPPCFSEPNTYVADYLTKTKTAKYKLKYNFILDGFHDSSAMRTHDAMYTGEALSASDLKKYGAKSSFLKLYGNTRNISHTKVIGNVQAAYVKYAWISVTPLESNIFSEMNSLAHKPIFFLPSMSSHDYAPDKRIVNFFVNERHRGEPILTPRTLQLTKEQYQKYMSRIIDNLPYTTSYNMISEILNSKSTREFPPSRQILTKDMGLNLTLKRHTHTLYNGIAAAPKSVEVASDRSLCIVPSIKRFWERYYDKETNTITLNGAITVLNTSKKQFVIPPRGYNQPLYFKGKGMIILKNGDLELRGCQQKSSNDCLSIILKNGRNIYITASLDNYVSVLAPEASVHFKVWSKFYGTLAAKTISLKNNPQGGELHYLTSHDPTSEVSRKFMCLYADDKESYWHDK